MKIKVKHTTDGLWQVYVNDEPTKWFYKKEDAKHYAQTLKTKNNESTSNSSSTANNQ